MTILARRSSLILPVNQPRFVERAYTRNADAIVLDLEDSVPSAEKGTARKLVKEALPLAARGGAEVAVRVNNEPGLLDERRRRRGVSGPRQPEHSQGRIGRPDPGDRRACRAPRARAWAGARTRPASVSRSRRRSVSSPRASSRRRARDPQHECRRGGLLPRARRRAVRRGTELLYAVSFARHDLQGRRHRADRPRRQHRGLPRSRDVRRRRRSARASSAAWAPAASTRTR